MLSQIFPHPLSSVEREGAFVFDPHVRCRVSRAFVMEESLPLMSEMWEGFTLGTGALAIDRCEGEAPSFTIGETVPLPLENQYAYTLRVTEEGIALLARDSTSLLHAFYTLLQLVRPTALEAGCERFSVDCCEILDTPALDFRCVHMSASMGIPLAKLKKYIRFAAFMKFSHLILEFWGSVKLDCLPELAWPEALTKEELRPLFEEARRLGLGIIPIFNSLGHASLSGLVTCKHTVLDQNPRLALLFEPDGWSFCISNPETRRIIRAASDEIIDLCGEGEYFHMGMDEAWDFGTCPLCAPKNKGEFFAEFVNETAAYMRTRGRRTMMWADMLLEYERFDPTEASYRREPHFKVAKGTKACPTHEALGKIDRDVLLVDWQYNENDPALPTSNYLRDSGYDVVTASWNDFPNIKLMAKGASEHGLFGYMSTCWGAQRTMPDFLLYSADAAWCANRVSVVSDYRLERSIHAVASLSRKLNPGFVSFADAGWN